jgi:hypothetical protein
MRRRRRRRRRSGEVQSARAIARPRGRTALLPPREFYLGTAAAAGHVGTVACFPPVCHAVKLRLRTGVSLLRVIIMQQLAGPLQRAERVAF